MNKDFYQRYMASNEWRAKRLARLKVDNFTCQTCGETEYLECHHRTYERLGNEDVNTDLITLCRWCHEAITNSIRHRRYEKKTYTIEPIKPQEIHYVSAQRVSVTLTAPRLTDAQWAECQPNKSVRQSD